MDDNQNDLMPTEASSNTAGRAAGAVKKTGRIARLIKSLKTFGLLGSLAIGVIIVVILIILIIGFIGFFLEMPGLLNDKISEIASSVLSEFQRWFGGDNSVYISDESQLELAQYLENMGYPPYEYGFGQYQDENGNYVTTTTAEDDATLEIDSKYLSAYLLADYNTYKPREKWHARISNFFRNLGRGITKFFGAEVDRDSGDQEVHFGMLNFDNSLLNGEDWYAFLNDIEVDMQSKTLTFKTVDHWNFLIPVYTTYTYNMQGWSARYGKPLPLSITLHLATMAPDLAYRVLMDEQENTLINIGQEQMTVRVRFKYVLTTDVTTNFAGISDEVASLDGKTEFTTEDFRLIKDFIDDHQQGGIAGTLQACEQNLNILLSASYSNYSDAKFWQTTMSEILTTDLSGEDAVSGFGSNSPYMYSIYQLAQTMDNAIEQAKEDAEAAGNTLTFTEDDYLHKIGLFVGGISFDADGTAHVPQQENSGIFAEYNQKLVELCNDYNLKSAAEFAANEDAKEEAFNFLKEKFQELYQTMQMDMDLIYSVSGDALANEFETELDKLGLSYESVTRALYYNDGNGSNEQGLEVTKMQPYIMSVTEHWYRNIYFSIDSIGKQYGESIYYPDGEREYVESENPGFDNVYTHNESSAESTNLFEPTAGSDDESMAPNDKGSFYVIETAAGGTQLTQVQDAVRGQVNPHTKELFVGTADKPAKYFVYDGSVETAQAIDELREIYDRAYSASWDVVQDDDTAVAAAEAAVEAKEAENGTDYFKEVDVRSNALNAFSILENTKTEDAEYILRDLKNLFVDLGYFTKEELRTKDTHVFQWPVSGYFNEYWPQNRFEKQQVDYGTLIRSKVSTDNIKAGLDADGTTRTESEQNSSYYTPNFDPNSTASAIPTTPDQPDDGDDEENEMTDPTTTLVDGFESGLNVVSPVTGEILEEGPDYIKIKVLDNTAISEYECFYNKYEDVCTGYIMYIKGFQKLDINSSSTSEYKEVEHSDSYFIKYGYTSDEMDEWREDEQERVDAPAYIERGGKRYIKEGTVIGTTTNSDIALYFINRENSMVEDVESYILLAGTNLDTDWAYFYWIPYESGPSDGDGNGPEAVGFTSGNEMAVGISQWTTINKGSKRFNNISEFCQKAIELNPSLCAELQPFTTMGVDEILSSYNEIKQAFETICDRDRDGFMEVQMQITINQYLIEPYTGTSEEWLLQKDPITQGTFMSLVNWNGDPSTWFAVFNQGDADEVAVRAMLAKACPMGSTLGTLEDRWNSQYVLARDALTGAISEEDLINWIKTKQPSDKYGEGQNPGALGY